MTYNAFLDTYFSSVWFGYGVPLVIMIVLIVYGKKIYRQKEYTLWMRAINIAIPFGLAMMSALVNPMYWGFGNPQAIDEIRVMDGKLIVMDHVMTYGSRYSSGNAYSRIHVLDPETGIKKIRFPVGCEAELIGMHGDSICVNRYNDAAYFSVVNGHCYTTYNRETLPKLFPQLSSGVENYGWGDGRSVMEITATDGSNWNLYLKTGHLFSTDKSDSGKKDQKTPIAQTRKLFIQNDEIRIRTEHSDESILELNGKNGNQHRKYIVNHHDSILNQDLVFLDGMLAGLNEKDSCFLILHFETLKKEKFILTCLSLDGKRKIWEIRQSTFNPTYFYPDYYSPHVFMDVQNGKVFFSIDKEVFCIQSKDGKLRWRMEL